MNILESYYMTSPIGLSEETAKFTVDDTSDLFVISGVCAVDNEYTFSVWLRSDAAGSVTLLGSTVPSTTEWVKHKINFPADAPERKHMVNGFKFFGGESNDEFHARAAEFLEKVKALDCDTVAAFTHAGLLRMALSIVFSTNINTTNFVCSNCCIVILELKNGKWMLRGLINPQ